jgi:hypothetical protein
MLELRISVGVKWVFHQQSDLGLKTRSTTAHKIGVYFEPCNTHLGLFKDVAFSPIRL